METQGQYLAARPPHLQRSQMWQETDTTSSSQKRIIGEVSKSLFATFLAISFGLMSIPIVYFIAIVHRLQSHLTTIWQKLLGGIKTKNAVVMNKMEIPPELFIREAYLIGMLKELNKSIKELQEEHSILYLELLNLQIEVIRRSKNA